MFFAMKNIQVQTKKAYKVVLVCNNFVRETSPHRANHAATAAFLFPYPIPIFFMSYRLMRVAAAAATIAILGAPSAFAAKNQSAFVFAKAKTKVSSSINSFAGNSSTINQISGGGQTNLSAGSSNTAVSGVSSTIDADSSNSIIVIQN